MLMYTVISAYDIFYGEPEEKRSKQEILSTDPYDFIKTTALRPADSIPTGSCCRIREYRRK